MIRPADNIQQAVDSLYKTHYGKIVSSLLHHFEGINLETIEDLVQDSFAAALTAWRKDGIPSNPAGWIFVVCRNRGIDKLKERRRMRALPEWDWDLHDPGSDLTELAEPAVVRSGVAGSAFDDQQLKLLISCAHPDLSPKVQVVITLKYVVNLKIDAIARVMGMTVDGIDKLLSRAKQKIRDEKILLELPPLSHLRSRLPIVHKIIYLIYNEGYKSSSGKEILNEELCEEALLINKALLDSRNGDKDTAALHALMLFNAARFKARFGISGELLDLEEQDRSLWNKELFLLACDFLRQSAGQPVSTYHYEASIAYLHCSATSFHSTNWTLISNLYQQILKISPNPFVELNYAIALYYSGEKIKALDILNALREQAFLNQYYLLNLTLGKVYLLEDDHGKAKKFFLRADGQTSSRIEKQYIQKMISRVKG